MFTMKEKVDSIVRNLKWEQARVRANVDGIYLNQGEIDRACCNLDLVAQINMHKFHIQLELAKNDLSEKSKTAVRIIEKIILGLREDIRATGWIVYETIPLNPDPNHRYWYIQNDYPDMQR